MQNAMQSVDTDRRSVPVIRCSLAEFYASASRACHAFIVHLHAARC